MKCPGGHSTVRCWSVASQGCEPRHHSRSRAELALNNQQSPINQSVTNLAVLNNGTNADIISTKIGSAFLAKTPEIFTHDADGNLMVDGQWTNTWNGENRLVALETTAAAVSAGAPRQKVEWSYLPDGRWSQRVVSSWNGSAWVAQSTNRFVWDGVVLLAVLNGNNQVEQAYLRGSDLSGTMAGAGGVGSLLAVSAGPNGVHFAAFDGNGNVVGLVSAADGAETARYEYSPFGETLRATGPMVLVNSLRFSTQFAEDVTGLVKYLYRAFNPEWGRWLNTDPIGELGDRNLYLAMNNTPLATYDTLGLISCQHVQITDWPASALPAGWGAGTGYKISGTNLNGPKLCWSSLPDLLFNCNPRWKLTGWNPKCTAITYYSTAWPPGRVATTVTGQSITVGQHEGKHVMYQENFLTSLDQVAQGLMGKCVSKGCAYNMLAYFSAAKAYYNAFADYRHNDLDCNRGGAFSVPYCQARNTLMSQLPALRQAMSQAASAANCK